MPKINLEDIFASKTQAKIINFFINNRHREFYQSELKNTLNESLGSLQYELLRLKRIGFLEVKRTKTRTYYKLNPQFSLLKEIKGIVSKVTKNRSSNSKTRKPKTSPKKASKKKK